MSFSKGKHLFESKPGISKNKTYPIKINTVTPLHPCFFYVFDLKHKSGQRFFFATERVCKKKSIRSRPSIADLISHHFHLLNPIPTWATKKKKRITFHLYSGWLIGILILLYWNNPYTNWVGFHPQQKNLRTTVWDPFSLLTSDCEQTACDCHQSSKALSATRGTPKVMVESGLGSDGHFPRQRWMDGWTSKSRGPFSLGYLEMATVNMMKKKWFKKKHGQVFGGLKKLSSRCSISGRGYIFTTEWNLFLRG